MNSTSRGSRLVSSAARSPGRSSTGPEVWRRLTPSSCAMMCESVVLPSPGGPNSSTWSSDSFRLRAASMKIESWPRIFSCPMYSSSMRGRSARSSASSCAPAGFAVTTRWRVSLSIAIASFYAGNAGMQDPLTASQAFARRFSACRMPSATATPSGSALTAPTASRSL